MQLVGYYLVQNSKAGALIDNKVLDKAERASLSDMKNNVFEPVLAPLSDNDRAFLKAMLEDADCSTVAEIGSRLGRGSSYAAQYKRRLLDQGVIEENYDKSVRFALPGMREFVAAHA